MAFFSPLTQAEWLAIGVEAYDAIAPIPANTGPGSTMGAVENSAAMQALQLQQQLLYLAAIARLYTIPALANGQPSPDTVSFAAPFNISPIGGSFSVGAPENSTPNGFTFTTPSPVSGGPLIIPVGGVAQTSGGLQFVVIADPSNTNYNSGDGGYPIPNSSSSTVVTMQCLSPGSIGNIAAGTFLSPYNSAGVLPIVGIQSISNTAALTNGADGESDQDFKARFTLTVSSGRAGTANAIIAAVLATQTGLIYSFGDRFNVSTGLTQSAFFSFIVNEANTGSGASTPLVNAAKAAINSVNGRSAGCSFICQGPSTIPVAVAGSLTVLPNFVGQETAVIAAVTASVTAFINGIGLNPGTTPTVCALSQIYSVIQNTQINGVNCINYADSVTLDGFTGDLSATFGDQFVFGSANFTTTN